LTEAGLIKLMNAAQIRPLREALHGQFVTNPHIGATSMLPGQTGLLEKKARKALGFTGFR
jgi:hypothetical protein